MSENKLKLPFELKKNEKLRFCLISTHIHNFTGYSKVSYELLKQLSKIDYLDLHHFGFQKIPNIGEEHRVYPKNVTVYNAAKHEEPRDQGFGFNIFRKYIERVKPHVVLIYNDLFVISQFINQLHGMKRDFVIGIYYDQVYEYTDPKLINYINKTIDHVFYFTRYWKEYGMSQGIVRPGNIILHGINPEMFYTMNEETQLMARKKMGFKEDDFIILNINRNTTRKRYDILVMAFAEFVKRQNAGYLLISTSADCSQSGWKFMEIYEEELRRKGILTAENLNRLRVLRVHMRHTDNTINAFYNIADVGINTAEGEGYGLCNFEHAAVGRPQIVGNLGGFKEFFNKTNTCIVEPCMEYYMPAGRNGMGGRAKLLNPDDVATAMEFYYLHPETRKRHGELVKESVLTYTWERATKELKEWLKVLNNVGSSTYNINNENKNETKELKETDEINELFDDLHKNTNINIDNNNLKTIKELDSKEEDDIENDN
jgi:glycosyltransferase involved in cell wall biosynthesis